MNKENLRYSDVETTRELMRTLSWQGQVVVLQRAHSIPDYKVFVWEIENYKEIELTN